MRVKAETHTFPIIWFGGGERGALNFPFNLSKIIDKMYRFPQIC